MDQPSHVSEGMPVHRWKPIADLPADRSALDRAVAEVAALRRAWAGKKAELEASGALTEFNARLSRQWCIETGILEGIYTLDRGATTTLIEHGFDAALLSHGDTNVGELTLIQILRDHQEAIDGLFAFVKQDRPLSTSYIRQLHQALLAHQDHFEVLDGQGRLMRRPLAKGDWKLLPNNPGDPRSLEPVHEYSPPEETAAEMDRLVAMHATHDDVEAEISAAWLHHRYVQIHPFPDGNGRVARALATLVLIQKGGFPLVVLRDDKNAYIDALRAADDGDLVPFVEFVCRLQKKALTNAIDQSRIALQGDTTRDTILAEARGKLLATAEPSAVLLRVMFELHSSASRRLKRAEKSVASALRDVPGTNIQLHTSDKTPRLEPVFSEAIGRTAGSLQYDAEVAPRAPWLYLTISQVNGPTDESVMLSHRSAALFFSFHYLGGSNREIGAVNSFILLGSHVAWTAHEPTTRDAFLFTATQPSSSLTAAFEAWADGAIDRGLEIWRRSL